MNKEIIYRIMGIRNYGRTEREYISPLSVAAEQIAEFEDIKHKTDDYEEFWYARELMMFLGYSNWSKFKKIIKKAIMVYNVSDSDAYSHFYETKTKVLNVEQENYQLSRIACYLIVQNCTSTKPIVCYFKSYIALLVIEVEKYLY